MIRHHLETMPFGATLHDLGTTFRLYAPSAKSVVLVCRLENGERRFATERTADGFHEVTLPGATVGTRYKYDIDGVLAPDPAARFAPDGVHGPSVVMDPSSYAWPEDGRHGLPWHEHVFYELHVGTFTERGTYAAALEKLDDLAALGVTAIELMPLAQAAGSRNWGYDGVLLYAPAHQYGTPDELKAFIAAAHARGLAVFLDVVYNHFGPEGNYLHGFAPEFYAEEVHTPWGAAIDVAPSEREHVRAYFCENAIYWLLEFRFDGLRLDAVDRIYDGSERRFLREIADAVRERVDRPVYLVVENDRNEAALLEAGFRAQWNDDAHHAAHVAMTGQTDHYYGDYAHDPIDLLGRSLTQGYVYQGQASAHRNGATRGYPSAHLELTSFVTFLQNHDQIGNRPFGDRIASHAAPEALRAMLVVMLLAAPIPLLFMGEEWAASTPFHFFCDFEPELAAKVTAGRRTEFSGYPEFFDPAARERIPDPSDPQTPAASTLRWDERTQGEHATWLAYYTRLLHLRKRHIVPRLCGLRGTDATYERSGERGLRVRYDVAGGVLALDANLGPDAAPDFVTLPHEGETIFATHEIAILGAPAWYARWSFH